ncbi:creatininase family protein [Pelagibacterium limicola]|uniref:creatininase family protein n=1 Tax=Pelagibacterium limicola TaxID=2791022 RepID=UPI0018AFF163|nr:creatininase family protein [Pelagibacterium limicola]
MPLRSLETLDRLDDATLSKRTVVILPVAATEAHGPHLPLSTDSDIAQGHIEALEAYLDDTIDAVALPIERIGASQEHSRFAGTESLPAAALIERWFGIAKRVAAAGCRRLVIVSSHGGNTAAVDTVILRARAELGLLAVGTAWMRFGFPEDLYPPREKKFGIHGGAIETSLMLHYRSDAVVNGEVDDFVSRLEGIESRMHYLSGYGPHRFGWLSGDLNAAGVVGDARLGSAEKGAIHADHILKGFAALVGEVTNFDLDWLT